MKEFYVLNLDFRRMAIIAGGTLVLLGATLITGMSIGRGQGERAAMKLAEEGQAQKLGLVPEAIQPAALPAPAAEKPAPAQVVADNATAPAAQSEIPLREDPLVQGPPKKKAHRAHAARAEREDAVPSKNRHKKIAARTKAEPEVSGKIDHAASGRYTIQVAAFKRSGEAQGLIARLKEEGIKAHTEKSGAYYLVTVGRSKSREKLAKALSRLKELEYDAYIRKIQHKSSEET